MRLQANRSDIKQAQLPHNLLIAGLFLLNLLMTPAVIALNVGMWGLLIPLSSTGALIAYIYLRAKKTTDPFIKAHWLLAFRNSRWLMLGYAISAILIFIAWLVSLGAASASMGHILWTALTRIAILPTLAGVMVTALTEAGAITQAGKCEIPDSLAATLPPQG